MQGKFLTLLSNSKLNSDGSLEIHVKNLDLLKDLKEACFFNDIPSSYSLDETINVELNAGTLKKNGIYKSIDDFFVNHIYKTPGKRYYIIKNNKFVDNIEFYSNYESVIKIIQTLKKVLTYNISENLDEYVGIFVKENKSLVLPLKYDLNLLRQLSLQSSLVDDFVNGVLSENESEKKSLFLNEVIEFLNHIDTDIRFAYLVQNLELYLMKANQSYEYYLRDFSFNKLKVEIDAKLLDFSQKLHSVINDAQNKLVAIPAGFVLVLVALDCNDILSIKNVASVFGLVSFVSFLKIFIDNQKSSLQFILSNISAYKETFVDKNSIDISKIFKPIEKEFTAQNKRMMLIELLLWFVPVATLSIISSFYFKSNWLLYHPIALYFLLGLYKYLEKFCFEGTRGTKQ